jgi:hypothetical protein
MNVYPQEEEERKQYANQVGADGWALLDTLGFAAYPKSIVRAFREKVKEGGDDAV